MWRTDGGSHDGGGDGLWVAPGLAGHRRALESVSHGAGQED